MGQETDDLDLNPDGGLDTLVDLRRPSVGGDSSITGVPSIILDPNKFRLERMLRREHLIYGIPTPFVGRREELELAYNAVRGAVNDHRLRSVGVSGASGVGKTRLLAEMFAIVDPLRRGIDVHAACCSESEPPDGIAVIGQLLRRRFGIQPQDTDAQSHRKIREALRLLVDGPKLDAAGRQMAYLVGLRGSGPEDDFPGGALDFQRLAIATFSNLFRYQAERDPQILVVHRTQFMTPRALTIFEGVVEALADTATVMIFLGDRDTPPSLVEASPQHTEVTLGPLGARDMERLVRTILQKVEDIPQGLVDDLIARSAGNPRLAEDNVRLLIQRGAIEPDEARWIVHGERLSAQIDLAATTEAASRARVAGLPEDLRHLLQLASVFGPAFWRDGVLSMLRVRPAGARRALVPWVNDTTAERLDTLIAQAEREQLVVSQPQPALSGQQELAFRYRDDRLTLYHGLDPKLAAMYHRLAAQWLAGLPLHDPTPWYEVIGEHLEVGQRPERAADWFCRAADGARESYALDRALALYQRALALVDTDRIDLLIKILQGLGETWVASSDLPNSRRVYSALLEASLVASDRATGAYAWLMLGQTHRRLGDLKRARPCLGYAESLYRELDDAAGIASVMDQIAKVAWTEGADGAYEEALRYFEQSLALRRRLGDEHAIAQSLVSAANAQLHCGRTAEAEERFRESLEIRRRLEDRAGEARSLAALGGALHAGGRREEARAAWLSGLELAEQLGDRDLVSVLLTNVGDVALEAGETDLAERCLRKALKVAEATGDQRAAANAHRSLGALAIAQSDLETAVREVDASISISQALGLRPSLALGLRTRAEILGYQIFADDSGDDLLGQKASQCFEGALKLFGEIGDHLEYRRTLEAFVRYLTERGDEAHARDVMARRFGEPS